MAEELARRAIGAAYGADDPYGVQMRRPARSAVALRRIGGGRSGQSLVEFAMVLPILLITFFAIIDFGWGLRSYVSLSNATREGARYAVVGNAAGVYPTNCTGSNTTTVIGRVCVSIKGLRLGDLQSVTVTYSNGQNPGSLITVQAHYHYKYITPLGSVVNFFTAGSLPAFIDLTTSANMRLE